RDPLFPVSRRTAQAAQRRTQYIPMRRTDTSENRAPLPPPTCPAQLQTARDGPFNDVRREARDRLRQARFTRDEAVGQLLNNVETDTARSGLAALHFFVSDANGMKAASCNHSGILQGKRPLQGDLTSAFAYQLQEQLVLCRHQVLKRSHRHPHLSVSSQQQASEAPPAGDYTPYGAAVGPAPLRHVVLKPCRSFTRPIAFPRVGGRRRSGEAHSDSMTSRGKHDTSRN